MQSTALLMSDMKPAVFWSRTPVNFWYDNVGVHSHHFGFWLELTMDVGRPLGDMDDSPCPVHQALGQFYNNTVHSNAQIGMRIYPEYTPLVNPCDSTSAPAPQYFYKLLSFRNGGNGLFSKRHGDLHHIGMCCVECVCVALTAVATKHCNQLTYIFNFFKVTSSLKMAGMISIS